MVGMENSDVGVVPSDLLAQLDDSLRLHLSL